jgi:uncharacterized protein (UPF0335 family)
MAKDELSNQGDNSVDGEKLMAFITRVEALEEEKKALADDIKDVKGEIKDANFDVKLVERIIKRRKEDPKIIAMEEQILRVYLKAIGVK